MKFIRASFLFAFIFVGIYQLKAQNSVGIGTQTPNPNAVLELVSPGSDQGLLVPRLTTTQRTAEGFTSRLTNAENGLMVFDVTDGQFYFWINGQWQSIAATNQALAAGLGINIVNGTISNAGDLDSTNEIQDLALQGNQLRVTKNANATAIDLTAYLDNTDNQTAEEVAFTSVGSISATDVQGAIAALDAALTAQPGGDMLKVLYDVDGDTVVDISAFALDAASINGLTVETAVPAGALFSDDQTASEVAFTPVGTLSATDVQDAIAQLEVAMATQPSGDMLQFFYDADGDTVVDISAFAFDAATVNGLMVETAVPSGALFSDDQTASEVAVTAVGNISATDVQGAIAALDAALAAQPGGDMLKLLYDVNGDTIVDISTFALDAAAVNGLMVETAVPAGALFTDDQTAVAVPYDNTQFGLAAVNVQDALDELSDNLDLVIASDLDQDPTNEIQDLSLATNTLTISNNPNATAIDLSIYLDNTDNQSAAQVTVAAGAGTLTSTDVQAALAELDGKVNSSGTGDMLKSMYDPQSIEGDAFNLTNHTGKISATQINDNAVTNTAIADGAVTSSKIGISATGGQVLKFNGTNWAPGLDEVDDADADATNELQSLTITGNQIGITLGAPINLSQNTPTSGQVLKYDGSNWNAAADIGLTIPISESAPTPGNMLTLTNTGTNGPVAQFVISGATNPQNPLRLETAGTGRAGDFRITNTSSSAEALAVITNGVGNSLFALNQGNSGSAANLSISNAGNSSPVLSISNSGSGNAITAVGTISATNFSGNASLLTNIPTTALSGAVPINLGGTGAVTDAAARTNLGLGSAATFDVGTLENNVVQLVAGGALPAVSGANLTNLPIPTGINTGQLADGAVTSAKITDGTIVDADIDINADIDGSKVVPNFGSQNIITTGTISGVGSGLSGVNASSFSGTLAGDVTGGQTTTQVQLVGGQTASSIASATAAANAATDLNTASTIVRRDATGNFSAGTITATLNGNASTSTSSINFTGSLGGDVTGSQGASLIANNAVTSLKIADGTIADTDISTTAAIAGTKITPNFGAQNIVTTGTLASANFSVTNAGLVSATQFSMQTASNSVSFLPQTQTIASAQITIPNLAGINKTLAFSEDLPITDDGSNTYAGVLAGSSLSSGQRNILIGRAAGVDLTTQTDNTLVGFNAGVSNTASQNTFIGGGSGASNTTGQDNTFVGYVSGGSNVSGLDNVAIGNNSGTGTTPVSRTIAIGKFSYVNADSAISLGYNAQATGQNSIAIGSGVIANNPNTIILGKNSNVGIGINTPNNKLHVNDPNNTDATIQITAGSTTGTSPTDGLLIGVNSAGVSMLNREATPINFGTNTFTRMTILANGNVGIGTVSPSSLLQVAGNITATSFTGDGSGLTNTSRWTESSGNVFRTTGNVGIGTNSPAQRLDVNGNVIIPANNDYMYAAPKSKIYAVTPGEFNVLRSAGTEDHVLRVTNGILEAFVYSGNSGQNAYLAAPLHLPDGAVITEIQVVGRNTNTTTAASFELIEKSYSTAFNAIPVTSIPQNTTAVSTFTNNALSVTINNNFNNYLLLLNALTNQSSLTGVRVFYTVTKAE